jgi:polysaccharide biosynthesis/export protein
MLKPRLVYGLLLLVALMLVSCSSGEYTSSDSGVAIRPVGPANLTYLSAAEPDTSIVMNGDSINFSVWGYPEFNTHTLVKLSGTITVPLIGEQPAAGLKAEELVDNLKRALAEYVKGEVKITLLVERPAPRVTVLGSVFRPGSFATKSDLSLLEVLAQVGGWTTEADLRYVRINRQATANSDASSLEINLALIMSRGNTRMIPMIRPGDVLIVPQRENVVREVSEFLRDALLLLSTFRIFSGGGASL